MNTNPIYFKKTFAILTSVICLSFYCSFGQHAESGKATTSSKTIVLANAGDVTIAAAPDDKQVKIELTKVKQKMSQNTPAMLQRIGYWDAGAPAYRWNQIGYQLTGAQFFVNNGLTFFKSPMAWMNMAIYDATVAALKAKQQASRKRPSEVDASIVPVVNAPATYSYPCEHAVTAGAAATVLAHFFPEVADSIIALGNQAAESRVAAGVQFPSDIEQGWKLGEQVAAKVIEKSKTYLPDAPWAGNQPNDSKHWKGPYPVGAITTTFKPLVLKTGDQFRPTAPPDFTKEMDQMKNFKQNFYTVSQAYYWAGHSGLDIWTELASTKIFENHLDRNTLECARIYAMLHMGIYDCAIGIMDAKYAYFGIRPDQMDPNYKPLIGHTPPFPGYPSGHATASATAAAILSHFFPQDAPMFKQLAQECADSRFYAGIHFPTDNNVGLDMGEKIGDYIFATLSKRM